MSHEPSVQWVESVIDHLDEICGDIKTFQDALSGWDSSRLLDQYGEYPPEYVAQVLLEAIKQKRYKKN